MSGVVVIGDALVDSYIYGVVSQICPEAPVPVFICEREESVPGGMWNALLSLRVALPPDIKVNSFAVGSSGGLMEEVFHKYLDPTLDHFLTTKIGGVRSDQVKTRYVADLRKQQVMRVDTEKDQPLTDAEADVFMELVEAISDYNPSVVLVCDYGCGVVTKRVMQRLEMLFSDALFIVDPYPKETRVTVYNEPDFLTPNAFEWGLVREQAAAARKIPAKKVVVTNGPLPTQAYGCHSLVGYGYDEIYADCMGELFSVPAPDAVCIDPCGAGDAWVAYFTAYWARGGDNLREAITVANAAGAVAVSKAGTHQVHPEDVAAFRAPCRSV